MKRLARIAMFIALFAVVGNLPAFAAFSETKFESLMQNCVKYLFILEEDSPNGLSKELAYEGFEKASAELQKYVSGLENKKELASARKSADNFIKKAGHEAVTLANVGNMALKMIAQREKFLAVHGE
ncbi:MAG TPA: hypothetical protein DCG57_01470 [Candidatus Riflebacteria bacterium]|jgi:hypothetical protein|nr:hypothetical protein [Candidatus Riflebacteria bacterium]